jgi:hypothetical protein
MALGLVLAPAVHAEERPVRIELKSGEVLEGTLVEIEERVYRVRVGDTIKAVGEDLVREVEFPAAVRLLTARDLTARLTVPLVAPGAHQLDFGGNPGPLSDAKIEEALRILGQPVSEHPATEVVLRSILSTHHIGFVDPAGGDAAVSVFATRSVAEAQAALDTLQWMTLARSEGGLATKSLEMIQAHNLVVAFHVDPSLAQASLESIRSQLDGSLAALHKGLGCDCAGLTRTVREAKPANEARGGTSEKPDRGVPWSKHYQIETEDFVFSSNAPRQAAQRYADLAQALRTSLERRFDELPQRRAGKANVYLFRRKDEFLELGAGYPGVASWYRPAPSGTSPGRLISTYHGGVTWRALAAEVANDYLFSIFAGDAGEFFQRPAWFLRGFSVYTKHLVVTGPGKFEPRLPGPELELLHAEMSGGGPPFLSDLVRLPQNRLDKVRTAAAWSLVYYLMHRGPEAQVAGKRVNVDVALDGFLAVLAEGSGARPVAELEDHYSNALQQAVGVPLEALEDDWRAFVLGLREEPASPRAGAARVPGVVLDYQLQGEAVDPVQTAIAGSILNQRLESLGLKRISLRSPSEGRVTIALPGVTASELDLIKSVIESPGRLLFKAVYKKAIHAQRDEETQSLIRAVQAEKRRGIYDASLNPYDTAMYQPRNDLGENLGAAYPVLLINEDMVDGRLLASARKSRRLTIKPTIDFQMKPEGRARLEKATTRHQGSQLAIVLDGRIISAPNVNSPIVEGSGIIEGAFTVDEVTELVTILNSGPLPMKLVLRSETVTPPASDPK